MVDKADIETAAMLAGEIAQLGLGVEIFGEDGRITSFTVMSERGEPPFKAIKTVTIQAQNMSYPPQMTATIIGLLNERIEHISDQLAALGVTGVAQSGRK